ncbi:ArsR family transcriptional regulator [Flavobacterium cyclinae]|uniref:ArsR family transcriptional regulator n=1 Tax=Flavobacterium cyclinae TaxID=2895947 RepID=UPI001E3E6F23|nr:ArsR family transcriptional regulator [Flavobacterium cyclinae]UGS20608.1 ArsR family transcriptional regulator [Flavobacterium cyclinae]
MLDSIITSKTRLRLLVKFFINAANTGYLRGLAQEMNENTNAIRKELNNLSEAGYILRKETDNKVMYYANTAHPLFATLQQLIQKYIGIDYIITQILERMGEISRIFLVGDYAKGIDSGIIEVVIEGEMINEEYIAQLLPKIKKEIKKEVFVKSTTEFIGEGLLIFENK